MRERLVRYLLGEMDAEEAELLECEVRANPALKRQLDHLRRCLPVDGDSSAAASPPGLANRTVDSVHDLVLGLETTPAAGEETATGGRKASFTFVDALVTVGVVLALGMMLLPALRESREASRRIACTNNMRELYQALRAYAGQHGGLFPMVQPGENAGAYTMRLVSGGYARREDVERWVVCPASSLGGRVACGEAEVRVPRPDELAGADATLRAALRRCMGGSYAYRLGYLDGPLYLPIANDENGRSPLLADAPHPTACRRWQSLNHGGAGQNVLFANGSVSYRVNCLLPTGDDNFFVNAEGRPAAGRRRDDAVLVRSEVTPGVMPTAQWAPIGDQPGRIRFRGFLRLRVHER